MVCYLSLYLSYTYKYEIHHIHPIIKMHMKICNEPYTVMKMHMNLP